MLCDQKGSKYGFFVCLLFVVQGRYDLTMLRSLEKYVAQAADISIPFNNYITGSRCASFVGHFSKQFLLCFAS